MRTAVIIMVVVIFILCFVLMPILMWTAPDMKEDDNDEDLQAYYDYLAELNALDDNPGSGSCKEQGSIGTSGLSDGADSYG
jgi:hypothetical protein